MGELQPTSNKLAIIHVLAALITDPLLFINNNYKFSIEDFPEQFHRIVFGAIEYLAKSGLEKIDYIDIDQFLKQYPVQYQVFCNNKGIEYIQNALKLYDKKKFDYYYNTLKKHSLLNSLKTKGIDTSDIYDPNIVDPIKSAEMQEHFDNLSVNDILLEEETKIILTKDIYGSNSDRIENNMGDNIQNLINELKVKPEQGLPLCSPKLTSLLRGQRLGCVYMFSAASGSGKTRMAIAESCHLAVPEYYDLIKHQWVKTNLSEKVLIIETELELKEVQTMSLAYISGVSEAHILDGRYTAGEEERVIKAGQLLEQSSLYIVSITNYTITDIIDTIKKYHQIYGVEYVFYDYLSESLKIMAESTRKTKVTLRTDQILLSMITDLKDCAKQLGVFIWTATQLSGDYKNAKELDAAYLRSAKSLADKVDVGAILTPIRETDKPIIDSYCAKGFELAPNFVMSIYKIRRGSYQNIRVYLSFDRSMCRLQDTFVTNNEGVILPIADTNIEIILDDTKTDKFQEAYSVKDDKDSFDFDF